MRNPSIGSVWAERGFGLVEVMVAAAVLGILATILVPVVQRRQGAGAESSALAVAREVQLSMERYAADRGTYPARSVLPLEDETGTTDSPPLSVVLGAYGKLAGEQVRVHGYTLIGGIYRLEVSITGPSGRGVWRYTITPSTITAQI